MTHRILKTIDFKITTRDLLWMQIFTASLEAGFSEPRAAEETDKAVEFIFSSIGTKAEAQLERRSSGSYEPIVVSVSKDLETS